MFCTNCGQKLPDNSRFCTNCGAQLGSAPAAAEPVKPELVYDGTFSVKQEEGNNRCCVSELGEVKVCEKCGSQLKPGAAFCEKCGARVKNSVDNGNKIGGYSTGNASAGNVSRPDVTGISQGRKGLLTFPALVSQFSTNSSNLIILIQHLYNCFQHIHQVQYDILLFVK